jgi:hypothetical protein
MPVTSKGYKPGYHFQDPPVKFQKSQRSVDHLIVTPGYEEYLLECPEVTADPEIFSRVMKELLVPQRDRSRSFSASAAGSCLRRQELGFLGAPPLRNNSPRGIRIFNNGTFVHLRWQIGLLAAGILDDIEYTVQRGITRATMDGIGVARRGVYKGMRFGWEMKSAMSFSWSSQERNGTPAAKVRKQVAMQMYETGYDVWSVTNENKDTQEISEFIIERDESEISDAKKELKDLQRAIEIQRLHPQLPECVKQNKTGEFYKCPFGTPQGVCVSAGNWPTVNFR